MGVEERIKVVEVLALGIDLPVIADAGTSLREIIREMRDRRASCALLTREGRLAGVFTERDVVTRVAGLPDVLDGPVAEVMTPRPRACPAWGTPLNGGSPDAPSWVSPRSRRR